MAGIVAMPQGPAPDKHKSLAGAPMNVPTGKKPMPWLCAGTENEVAVLTITVTARLQCFVKTDHRILLSGKELLEVLQSVYLYLLMHDVAPGLSQQQVPTQSYPKPFRLNASALQL